MAVATTANSEAEKQQHSKNGAPVATATDGLNSLVQAAGIQIVSDADGTRVQQYKCAMQVRVINSDFAVSYYLTFEFLYQFSESN